MREKLARALFDHDVEVLEQHIHGGAKWETESSGRKASYFAQVDAILDAMMEPSEEMLDLMCEADWANKGFKWRPELRENKTRHLNAMKAAWVAGVKAAKEG